jgi:hypothetical protein
MASVTASGWPSSGAGYDDQANNYDADRDPCEVSKCGTACASVRHELNFEFTLHVF